METNDLSNWTVSLNGKVWTPTRKGNLLSRAFYNLEQKVQQIQRRGPRVVDKTSGAAVVTQAGLPRQVISVAVTESASAQVDRVYSQIAVSFTRDPADKNFAGVHIWFTGYKGNSQPVLMTDAQDSPAVFLCETTGENVTVTVQPFNPAHISAPFAGARTGAVALNGQTSAPAAPSIASQTATITSGGVTVGQQFAFNYLPASLTDVIDGYWIYRTNVHSTPGISSRWKFVKASVQNSGVYTCVDSSGVSSNFYYVSAINKQGLESSLTDCAAGSGGTTGTYRPTTFTTLAGDNAFSNPANVWDGNFTSYSSAASPEGGSTYGETWQGFANATGVNSTTLYISCSGSGGALSYSTNGGTSFTSVSVPASQTTVSISLSVSINLSNIVVKGFVGPHSGSAGTNILKVYEIYVQTT